jgi:hypothetical protein
VAQSVAADTWDQWNSDRDQVLSQLGANASAARASTGNPDDPAWSDLDYYGDWYNVPGYGAAWAPAGVGSSWDPFGSGYWGYYGSGVGYSWISGYSWGWWPYHCGAWNFFNSYGWLWFPGNCGWGAFGSGWYPYSTVWRVPRGYKPPLRPVGPVHGHGPITSPRLLAVNRGPQATGGFRSFGQPKPVSRPFGYNGQNIDPVQANIRPRAAGPLGESFTQTVERKFPDSTLRARPGNQPGMSVAPVFPRAVPNVPHTGPQPVYRGGSMGSAPSRPSAPSGSGGSPHMSTPSGGGGGGTPHASAPSGGGGGGSPHH